MITRAFLDSSVLIDALHPEHAEHHRRAMRLMERARSGEVELHVNCTVLLETAFVLERRYLAPRNLLAPAFRGLLGMPSVVMTERPEVQRTIDLWEAETPLSFADCYYFVLAESLGLEHIYSFDRKMGRYPAVERIEP